MANVHHHLAVLVPKTFHTPRTVNYWNEIAKERSTLHDRVLTPRVPGNTLADELRVLVGPVAPHELQARSNSLLAHTAMRQQELGFYPPQGMSPGTFF